MFALARLKLTVGSDRLTNQRVRYVRHCLNVHQIGFILSLARKIISVRKRSLLRVSVFESFMVLVAADLLPCGALPVDLGRHSAADALSLADPAA